MKRQELHFDGHGINGPDEYRTRVVTFTFGAIASGLHSKYGPLFEAAPELLQCVRDLIACAEPHRDRAEIKRAREVLKKLEASNAAHS